MIRRFLLYSLAHQRPVKALFSDTMKYRNITVTALDEHQVTYTLAGKKTPVVSPVDAILSVSYARGDDGDTLQYALAKEAEKIMQEDQP